MAIAIVPKSMGAKADFYYDNRTCAVEDLEYMAGLAEAAAGLLRKLAAAGVADPELLARAEEMAELCEKSADFSK